jgi:hypothetical protein
VEGLVGVLSFVSLLSTPRPEVRLPGSKIRFWGLGMRV